MSRSQRDTALVLSVLLLILALAAAVRFYRIGEQSLWSDEGNSAALATRSLQQITQDAAYDIHPPLYYWLLHLWTGVFGTSEAALRSLSAVLGIGLVLGVFSLGRGLYGDAAGLAAAFISALAPFQVYYSQEARMYILLALESAIAVLLFWRLLVQEGRLLSPEGQASARRLRLLPPTGQLLTITWAAGLYTHYEFPLMMALMTALYLFWVWLTWRRGSVGFRSLRWALWLGLALLLFSPWLATAVHQLTTWPANNTISGIAPVIEKSLTLLGLGPVPTARGARSGDWGVWPVLFVAALGAIPWQVSKRASLPGGPARFWMRWLIPLTWACAPLVMILGFGLYREAYLKFLLIASPAFSLLLAEGILAPALWIQGLSDSPRASGLTARGVLGATWIIASLALVAGLFGATLGRYYTDPSVARDDYRGIAQFIAATAQPNDAILLDAPGQSEVFEYYYHGDLPVFALPRQRPMDPDATRRELEKLLAREKIYAVYWASEEADPQGFIQNWLDSHAYKTLDQWRGNVRLAAYVMPSRLPPDDAAENLHLQFGDGITLLGYRAWNPSPAAGDVTQLQLVWQADRKPSKRYKVFLQLLDSRDQVIAQRDAEPAGESRPTDTWKPAEIVLDNHGLLIPPGTPPGTYRRIVGLYDPVTLERLQLLDGSDHVDLPPVTVSRARIPPLLAALGSQDSHRFDFGAISLLGHDRYKRGFGHAPETPIQPGDPLHLTFYWRANAEPRADWWFDLILSDRTGETVASLQAPLVSETYSTRMWQPGEIVRGEHDLMIPESLPAGTYRLSLVMNPDTDTPAGTAYLGSIRISRPALK
jgi:mannosyltransferase